MADETSAVVEVGAARLAITFDCGAEQFSEHDMAALGAWWFRQQDLREVVPPGWRHFDMHMAGRLHGKALWDKLDERIYDDDDEWVEVEDADASIMVLALFAQRGGPFEVRYASLGSSFWAFHDLSHVRNDVWLDERGGGLNLVSAAEEDRAHCEGAREGIGGGVISLAEVVRAVVAAEPSFVVRFGSASAALEQILAHYRPNPAAGP